MTYLWNHNDKAYSPNGDTPVAESPETTDARNRETSAREVSSFTLNRPSKVFAYVSLERKQVQTWMGDKLGDITYCGRMFRDNFGGQRIPIRVRGSNGILYHGTYYTSAGDYCRLTASKVS